MSSDRSLSSPLDGYEQLFLELTNWARINPAWQAEQYGIGLNDDVSGPQITAEAKAVLAPNAELRDASLLHSAWMLENDVFSHTGDPAFSGEPGSPFGASNPSVGSNIGERAAAAGYDFDQPGTRWVGENLAWSGTTGTLDREAAIYGHAEGLFKSVGHRLNLLSENFREAGVGIEAGVFTAPSSRGGLLDFNASMLTNKFATAGRELFVTGVAFADTDDDRFYSLGEGLGGVTFATSATTIATGAAGGYSLAVSDAATVDVDVTFAGQTWGVTVALDGENAKLDLWRDTEFGDALVSDRDMTLGTGVVTAALIGVRDGTLTGNALDNTLAGGNGDDTIAGGAGVDQVVYQGARSEFTVTDHGGGAWTVEHAAETGPGGYGRDVLSGVERVIFDDATLGGEAAWALTGTLALAGGTALSGVDLALQDPQGTALQTARTGTDGGFEMTYEATGLHYLTQAQTPAHTDSITAGDALDVLRMAVGIDTGADAFDFIAADVNRDGQITAGDALEILRYAVGLGADGVGDYIIGAGAPGDQSATSVSVPDATVQLTGGAMDLTDIWAVRLGDLGIYDDGFS